MQTIFWEQVSISLESADMTPDQISNLIGCVPSAATTKGLPVSPKNPRSVLAKSNIWILRSDLKSDASLDQHLDNIRSKFKAGTAKLLQEASKFEVRVFCLFSYSSDTGSVEVSKDAIEFMASIKAEFITEVYRAEEIES